MGRTARTNLIRMEALLMSVDPAATGSIQNAPCDPVFWMHHAEIDRIWAAWQQANPGLHPPLVGAAATMDPWTETEVETRDTVALGYTYV